MDIPIVVATFNRPDSLKRILESLNNAKYATLVKLYISIDGGGDDESPRIANKFKWLHGKIEVIHHDENLGLRDHIISCGNLVLNHDAIILLEDDLYVSAFFYSYVQQTADFYKNENMISGVSLYSHIYNETAEFSFLPIEDGFDMFFLQLASSWGQCWTKNQWIRFRDWYSNNYQCIFSEKDGIPFNIVDNWSEKSWKKYFIKYMIDKNLFFAYPQLSFSTNFGDSGINHIGEDLYQVPLNYNKGLLNLSTFNESLSKYDCYCEILPECLNKLTNKFVDYSFVVDLYGTKPVKHINHKYILTSRPTSTSLFTFGKKMVPHEENIIAGVEGEGINFTKVSNVKSTTLGFTIARMVYYHRLPDWHKKTKIVNDKPVALDANEVALLKIFSKPIGRFMLLPILALHRIYVLIKNKLV